MTIEIRVPTLGESVTEATVARWLKQPGETITRDEPVVELETDKVTLEVPDPAAGTLGEIRAGEGTNVPVGAVLGIIADGTAGSAPHPGPLPAGGERERGGVVVKSVASPRSRGEGQGKGQPALERAGPAARKLIAETALDAAQITPTGRGGRITKQDVVAASAQSAPSPVSEPQAQPTPVPPREQPGPQPPPATVPPTERETRVRMTRLRRRIAERLKEAQQNAAMLTTFNAIDMSGAIALRQRWREAL